MAPTHAHLAAAGDKIVYDKFHIAQDLAKAVDQGRRAENKQLRAAGDERQQGSKYQWLRPHGELLKGQMGNI